MEASSEHPLRRDVAEIAVQRLLRLALGERVWVLRGVSHLSEMPFDYREVPQSPALGGRIGRSPSKDGNQRVIGKETGAQVPRAEQVASTEAAGLGRRRLSQG